MSDLIKRVESATGPDRELDLRIWAEFDGRDVREDGQKILAKSRKPPHDECLLGWIDPGKHSRNFQAAMLKEGAYTSSLDAAVSLCERVLPKGVQWTVSNSQGLSDYTCHAIVWVPKKTFEIDGRAPTPALARVLAILRAHPDGGSDA